MNAKKITKKSKTHQTILLPKDLIKRVQDVAKTEKRSLTKMVEVVLSSWLDTGV